MAIASAVFLVPVRAASGPPPVRSARAIAAPAAATAKAPTQPWKLRELDIVNGRITLTDLGVGTTSVGFNIETTLKDIPLSAAMGDTADRLPQVGAWDPH